MTVDTIFTVMTAVQLVDHDIGHNEIRPLVGKTCPLKDVATTQQEFLTRTIAGKLPRHSRIGPFP